MTTPGFIARRLTEARQARGLSATDLASLVGVSVQSISKYEHGRQSPKIDVLHSLASALRMPRQYFLLPTISEGDDSPIFWRGRLSAPAVMRNRAAVRLEWMKEVVDYVANYFELPPLDLPEIDVPSIESLDQDFFERTADALRFHWDIRPGPMPDVIEKLETNGILVARIHVIAEKLDAFSQWSNRFGTPFVLLGRDKASAVRQRFDALHELAHITVHRSISQKRLNDPASYKRIEQQADRIASCLLLPAKEFSEELYAPSLDGFLVLKERWGASVGAMIMKCRALDILDDAAARRLWINYNRRGWRTNEPLDNKIEKERPYAIRRSFELLISEGVQSPQEILAALPLPPNELEEIADLEPGTLTGETENRVGPTLRDEFRRDAGNVVPMFRGRKT